MASNLVVGYTELRKEIGRFLGYGATYGNWTAEKVTLVDDIINAGVRQFCFPPPLKGERDAHEWSFLRPITTLDLIAPYSTGTVASEDEVVTLTDGVFPSWAATNGVLIVNGEPHSIASRDGDTQITLDESPDTAFDDDEFILLHNNNYELPDTFGAIEGPFMYDENYAYAPIEIVSEETIRKLRQGDTSYSFPEKCAIVPKTTTGIAVQRFEAWFWPASDIAYELSYRYLILVDKLTSTYLYAYGSMVHSETLLNSCLQKAEKMLDDISEGNCYKEFMKSLATSVHHDRKAIIPEKFGYNGDGSDDVLMTPSRALLRRTVTFEGVSY